MKIFALVVAATAAVLLSGCDLFNSIFGSTAAAITSFTIDGIVGSATIDPAAHSVTVTVEPMDITGVAPTVALSSGATYTFQPIQDGVAVPFTVTSQQGSSTTWNVTVNVQDGISFTLDSRKIVLTAGYEDQNATYTPAAVGNGKPVGYYDGSYTDADAYASLKQIPWDDTSTEMATVDIIGQTTGTYGDQQMFFEYHDPVAGLNYLTNTGLPVVVTKYDPPGGVLEGTFAGAVGDNSQSPTTHPLTKGFFKAVMMADGTPFIPQQTE